MKKMIHKIYFTKEDWQLLLCSMFMGVFVYFARIANELPNPDAIWLGMAYKADWGWEGGLGRYMIGFLQKARSYVVSTEFISLTCILFLAIVCVCVVRIFEIEDKTSRLIIAGLLVVSPTVGSTLSYYYCSDMYFLSYLLAVGVVLIAIKCDSWVGYGLYAIGICLSASIYQAYLGVTITLCFLYLLYMVWDEKCSLYDVGIRTAKLLIGGCAGVVLYLTSNKTIQAHYGIQAIEERGFASMGHVSISDFPGLIRSAYISFYEYFFSASMVNNLWGGKRKEINALFFLCAVLFLVIILFRKKIQLHRKMLLVSGFLLLPIPVMSIVIMAPEVSIYNSTGVLMLPTMNYVYVAFYIFLAQEKHLLGAKVQKSMKAALAGCCVMVCYMLVILELSGQAYIKHHMNKTGAVAAMMVNEIEEVVDNSANYRLCIIGMMENGNYPEIYDGLRYSTHWTSANHKTIWRDFNGAQQGWVHYISHYLGKEYSVCSGEEYQRILQSKEYAEMVNFPDTGSVCVVDDIVVIKLSDV